MLPIAADKSAYRPNRFRLKTGFKPILALLLMIVVSAPSTGGCATPSQSAAVSDYIRELIEAARGAPPARCACAATAVQNTWGWTDAPASPLGRSFGAHRRQKLSDEDVRFLLTSLDTPDPCVRELAVRLLANCDRAEVVNGLAQRLGAADSSLRLTASLGLGLVGAATAVEPLIRATRDDAAGVRANAVWALGRIEDPRGAGPATTALGDRSAIVREAAAEALGHLEVKSAAPQLTRALREDRVAAVRRTAAWALTQIEVE